MWPFRKAAEESSQITIEHVQNEYRSLTQTLQEKLALPKTPENLKLINSFQYSLADMTDHVMKFSDFFTSERVESIWDLLHESKNYLLESTYELDAKRRCKTFVDRYISGERAREAMLRLYKLLLDAEYKDDLVKILNL